MNSLKKLPKLPTIQTQQSERNFSQPFRSNFLFNGILEGFVDGLLILSEQGDFIHANQSAKRVLHQLNPGDRNPSFVPSEIWQVCQSLIESRELFPDQKMIIESEISKSESIAFRIRVQWLELEEIKRPCLLVTLEDRYQSLQTIVINDAYKYSLTPREMEVWLLYRANYSYKEIADELYISLNTVKKHMKNIHAKRKASCDDER